MAHSSCCKATMRRSPSDDDVRDESTKMSLQPLKGQKEAHMWYLIPQNDKIIYNKLYN